MSRAIVVNLCAILLLLSILFDRLRQCCGHLSLLKQSFDPELLQSEKKELALEDVFQSLDIANSSGLNKNLLLFFDV